MFEKQNIINYKIVNGIDLKPIENVYQINKNNKIVNWIIQKLLKYKIITQYQEEIEIQSKVKDIKIDIDKIHDMIHDYMIDMYRYTRNRPTKVILGNKQMECLDIEINHLQSVYIPFNYNLTDKSKQIYDLEIILNPFIDGIVVI